MCRISGIINPSLPLAEIEAMVGEMCQLQKHGGPDGEGMFSSAEDNMVLGHRRLSLLDLTDAGCQPMHYQDRYSISFNGEIYNYRELKSSLQALGHEFHNHTDTEVILAAFAQWNTQSFARLNGMFAFAIWDKHEHTLYLVRGPVGIKPLYYSDHDGKLAFASEIRALVAIPYLSEPNPEWPVFLLAYGHLPEPVTTLKYVKPLPKGCFYTYRVKDTKGSLQSYLHFSFSSQVKDEKLAEEMVRTELEAAVKRQLVADANIGVFLSGGLDSSIITLLAANEQKEKLNTLSIYFEEKAFSEKSFQDDLIKQLNCNHYQHLLKQDEFEESLPYILDAMDMPGSDGINTWFISKYAAKQGLKAVLSGIGGDELFGGYPSFNRMQAAGVFQAMSMRSGFRMHTSHKKLDRFAYLRMPGLNGLYLFLRGHFTSYDIARQLDMPEKQVWDILSGKPCWPGLEQLDPKNKASWMEYHLYMQNQLLRDADVMSMTHGVEIRVPFLDNELIKLAFKIDPAIKFAGALPKQILINAFKEQLPRSIWDRPKMGFTLPFAQWLAASDWVRNMFSGNDAAGKEYQKFIAGRLHWSQLMSLILLNQIPVGKPVHASPKAVFA